MQVGIVESESGGLRVIGQTDGHYIIITIPFVLLRVKTIIHNKIPLTDLSDSPIYTLRNLK